MQHINLFHAQFKPKNIIFPARQIFLLMFLFIIILAVMSFYSFKQNMILDKVTSVLQRQSVEQVSNEDTGNPLLLAELAKIQLQQQEKDTLLAYLKNQKFGNQDGFSQILTTLSQQGVKKVWLTEFSLLSGGQMVILQGQTTQASQVPAYIDSLAQSSQFQGRKFSALELQHPSADEELYSFQLKTDAGNP